MHIGDSLSPKMFLRIATMVIMCVKSYYREYQSNMNIRRVHVIVGLPKIYHTICERGNETRLFEKHIPWGEIFLVYHTILVLWSIYGHYLKH